MKTKIFGGKTEIKGKEGKTKLQNLSLLFSSVFLLLIAVALVSGARTPFGGEGNWDSIIGQFHNETLTQNGTLRSTLNVTFFDFNATTIRVAKNLTVLGNLNASVINSTNIFVGANRVQTIDAIFKVTNLTDFLGSDVGNGSIIREGNLSTILVDGRIANDLTIETTKNLLVGGGFGGGGITLSTAGQGSFQDILIAGNLTLINEQSINGSMLPAIDAVHLLGNGTKRWISLNVSGMLSGGDLTLAGASFISTTTGDLTLSPAGNLVVTSGGSLTGTWSDLGSVTTIDINGGTVDGISSLTVSGNVDIGGFDIRALSGTFDSLTSGRVTFASTDGLLVDDSDLTFVTDTLTVTKIGAFEATGTINLANNDLTNIGGASSDWTSSALISAVPLQLTSTSNSYFTGGGSLGIGNTIPNATLDVSGNVSTQAFINISGANNANATLYLNQSRIWNNGSGICIVKC